MKITDITDITVVTDFIEILAGSWSVVLCCVGVVWCGVFCVCIEMVVRM